jgi:Ca-activated chloride channel family protein
MKTDTIETMRTFTMALAVLALAACSDGGGDSAAGDGGVAGGGDEGEPASDDGGAPPLGPGVGQGGAQDFGQFRAILEAGGIPGPDTLDDVGFFNEHKIELPAAECGDDVCMHGALAMMGNLLTGTDCTMLLLGMNTPIDPAEIERPPLNLAIAVDTSGSMAGEPILRVREGLHRMLDVLRPEDRVTLLSFADGASLRAELSGGDSAALEVAIAQLDTGGQTNVYEGLWAAYEAVEMHAEPGLQNRVLLLSDGIANVGITNDDKIVELAAALSGEGVGLSTIGLGVDFDPLLMRRLAEVGSGTFYFVDDVAAVEEIFEEEAQALLLPIAVDVALDVDVASGWELRAMYGTKLAEVTSTAAHVRIPSLHIAHRESTGDNEHGRRGGGGVMLVEVMPRAGATPPEDGSVGELSLRYRVPGTDEEIVQAVPIASPDGPDATGYFSTPGAEKSFVMLNLYVAFRMASERATAGDDAAALSILGAVRGGVAGWLAGREDFDIEDDLRYVDMFLANLQARAPVTPPEPDLPPEPWPAD